MRKLAPSATLVSLLFVLSCGPDAAPPPTTGGSLPALSTAPPARTPAYASKGSAKSGVETSAMDTSANPCDDFYQYACGSWNKNTEIPGDEAAWYRSFSVIRDRNEEILKGILEGLAKGEGDGGPYGKQLGEYYATCMDEAAIEAAGTKPLAPWLRAIDEAKSPQDLTKVMGKFQAELGSGILFSLAAAQDFGDATKVVGMVWQGGLGMPEKEYYSDTSPKMKELRGIYEGHVAAMMKLAGEPEAKAKQSAATVLKIETQIAAAWMSKEDRREPKKMHHHAERAELAKIAPGISWDLWLDAAGAKDAKAFNVAQPEFMKAVAGMLDSTVSLPDWKTYLRWHIYRGNADELPKKFVDEKFRWRKALVGTQKLPDRWKRCVRAVDGGLGEALAQPFVKKTLGAEGKTNVVGMVQAIEKTMEKNLGQLRWMDEPTRKDAQKKLARIANKIAYPDKFRSYDGIGIAKDGYLLNSQRAAAFEHKRQMAKIGKPVDRAEWQMSPPTVNAYYDAQLNEMVFPAGILQPPFYANTFPKQTNFGGVGMVMGHELTHGFDDEGRQFDAEGNLRDWWSPAVNTEFDGRAECVRKQFDGYKVLDGVPVNGKLTLGENIADLGGVKLAYHALISDPALQGSSEFTPAQEFFLGFAQAWCGKMRDEALRHQVATNPHSPAIFRVNGPLSNLTEFAQAFSCKPGSKMVRADRCEVW